MNKLDEDVHLFAIRILLESTGQVVTYATKVPSAIHRKLVVSSLNNGWDIGKVEVDAVLAILAKSLVANNVVDITKLRILDVNRITAEEMLSMADGSNNKV